MRRIPVFGLVLWTVLAMHVNAAPWRAEFQRGVEAYDAGEFDRAAAAFRETIAQRPASGVLQNLGNAEWQRGEAGHAVLAWERAAWLNPFVANARNNLQFARHTNQLEPPDLTWYEIASTWLPVNWWAWIAGVSLWLALGATLLPGILRYPKRAWQQVAAAVFLGMFLLSLPAHVGALTRSNVGFILKQDTPLLLTPTTEGEAISHLGPGDPVRTHHSRGTFLFVRANRQSGWIERSRAGFIGAASVESGR